MFWNQWIFLWPTWERSLNSINRRPTVCMRSALRRQQFPIKHLLAEGQKTEVINLYTTSWSWHRQRPSACIRDSRCRSSVLRPADSCHADTTRTSPRLDCRTDQVHSVLHVQRKWNEVGEWVTFDVPVPPDSSQVISGFDFTGYNQPTVPEHWRTKWSVEI